MSKVGINGFGRIGRLVLRRLLEVKSNIDVVAINDLTSPKILAYLLKHDSNYGPFPWSVDFTEDSLIVDGKSIAVYAEKEAKNIPWKAKGAEIIVECTGFYTSAEKSQAHLDAGAKKVLISAPAGEMKTIVYNVNDDTLDGNDTIVSVASCTTNCLAPMAKALHDSFGIEVGTMTTIHAYTGTQSLVDGPRGKDLRASRAAAENIIPHTTGAAKAIGLVIPELSGKLKGHAQRVPVKTGSVTELVSILGKKVTAEEVNNALKQATTNNESFGYTDEEIVSSDIIGRKRSPGTITNMASSRSLFAPSKNSLNSDAHRRRKKPPPLLLITTVNKPPGSADIHAGHVYHLRRQYRIYAIRRGSLA